MLWVLRIFCIDCCSAALLDVLEDAVWVVDEDSSLVLRCGCWIRPPWHDLVSPQVAGCAGKGQSAVVDEA